MSSEALHALVAGSIAGMASVFACHPIDCVRTRVQIHGTSSFSVMRDIARSQGLAGFYRGIGGPFVAQAVYKSTIFSSNTLANRYLFTNNKSSTSTFFSGCIAGTINAFIVSPVELLRTRQIMNPSLFLVQSIQSVLQEPSGFRGMWRGVSPTILRDGPGLGLYFLAFDASKQQLTNNGESKLDLWKRIVAGSCAGVAFWIWALPVDSIKTVIEAAGSSGSSSSTSSSSSSRGSGGSGGGGGGGGGSSSSKIPSSTRGMLDSLRHIVKSNGGIYNLFRAWPVAFGRGIPSAVVTLTVFDLCMERLGAGNKQQQ